MKRLGPWLKTLTTVSKTSILGSLAFGGLFVASALTPTVAPVPAAAPPQTAQTQAQSKPIVTTKNETETQAIPFDVRSIQSSTIANGVTEVQTTGINGLKTITHTITLTDGVETGRTTAEAVTTAPVAEVTATGTYVKPAPSCDSNYSGCVPIVSYDLDCRDIGFKVRVLGTDTHSFDRDGDGVGCESY